MGKRKLHTRLCDVLGMEYPIIQAGMGGFSDPPLVIAVSEAGGLGTLGAATYTADGLNEAIAEIRRGTSKPFAIDMLLPDSLELMAGVDKEMLARVDKAIDFEWKDKPHEVLPKDKFSIRWVGKIKIPKSGKYTLSVKADDGAKIWIGKMPDLKQIISNWTEYSYAAHKKEIYLEEGLHDVKIEYYENGKNAAMRLFWDSEDTKKQIVPTENLFHVSL